MNETRRAAREKWRQIIEGQQASGLTVAAYCREQKIAEGSFFSWKRRLRPSAKPRRLPTPAFVEVKPSSSSAGEAVEICLRGQRHLVVRRGFDRDLLSELIAVLEGLA